MSARRIYYSCVLAVFIVLILILPSIQLQSSQARALFRLQRLLNFRFRLSSLDDGIDFCNAEPTSFATIVCYEENITQLHISGSSNISRLPNSFSIDLLFTTLTRLSNLKVLSLTSIGLWGSIPAKISRLSYLEILNLSSNLLAGTIPGELSRLKNLQTLILDHNNIDGTLPDWIDSFPLMVVLSLKNNAMNGSLPVAINKLQSLRVLALSFNAFSGPLHDLSGLVNLQVLDLESNHFGPQLPSLNKGIVKLVMRNNSFAGRIPSELSSYYFLQQIDFSSNRLAGPFMPSMLSLPSIQHINVSGNRFTGVLCSNISCNDDLKVVDLSSNLLIGNLPTCLSSRSKGRIVLYAGNCLENKDQIQLPNSFCLNQAFAADLPRHRKKKASFHKAIVAISVAGTIVAILIMSLVLYTAIRRAYTRRAMKRPVRSLIEHASYGYPSKLLADARYISQTMKLGSLGIPSYRSFSLDELEAATNNFDSSAFIGEDSLGQMYRGKLIDGSFITIRCLKIKKRHSSQNFNLQVELISKLRNPHLVSSLGHCFEYYLEDSTVSTLFLIFEYVSNGTLRSNISEQRLSWAQRVAAAIGVAKGIQFLHAGMVPGLFANDLTITNVLLDHNLLVKISSYNLPFIDEIKEEVISGASSGSKELDRRTLHEEKIDIFDFGLILLEIISGKPIMSRNDAILLKVQLEESISINGTLWRRSIVDPAVRKSCCNESLKTVSEICIRCIDEDPAERPSVEDVLWNLQFAAQVQEAWRGDSNSNEGSPLSPHLRVLRSSENEDVVSL